MASFSLSRVKNRLILFMIFLFSSFEVFSVEFDVELICKKTFLSMDRGIVLAGIDRHPKDLIKKEDNIKQLYKRYCFLDEEKMRFQCDDYIRLDKDFIWTMSGNKLERKTLEGSLSGLGGGLKCFSNSRGSAWFKRELDAKVDKYKTSLDQNIL